MNTDKNIKPSEIRMIISEDVIDKNIENVFNSIKKFSSDKNELKHLDEIGLIDTYKDNMMLLDALKKDCDFLYKVSIEFEIHNYRLNIIKNIYKEIFGVEFDGKDLDRVSHIIEMAKQINVDLEILNTDDVNDMETKCKLLRVCKVAALKMIEKI